MICREIQKLKVKVFSEISQHCEVKTKICINHFKWKRLMKIKIDKGFVKIPARFNYSLL